jgi:hypothetical protein
VQLLLPVDFQHELHLQQQLELMLRKMHLQWPRVGGELAPWLLLQLTHAQQQERQTQAQGLGELQELAVSG